MKAKKKNILVQFDIQVGEYEHSEHYLFDKKCLNGNIVSNFGT